MIEFLTKTFQITKQNAELFAACFEKASLKKGEVFVEFGKECDRIGFVEKGLLKCTLIGTDRSVVDDFVFENQFVGNYYSFLKREPSNKEIICLKDSELHIITRQSLEKLATANPFVEQIGRQVAEQLFLSTSQKLEELKLLSAEERYLKLTARNKRIIDEIPQYEIASYLNVSPETVSRIRNKVASA